MGKNGFKQPKDTITNPKCKGIAKEKNAEKFKINWSYGYPADVAKTRNKYPETWGGAYGQWSTMEQTWDIVKDKKKKKAFLTPPREKLVKGWTWTKAWNSTSACTPLFDRANWYPYSGKPRLKKITMAVYGHNDAGSGPGVRLPEFVFDQPKKPTIDSISYNNDNGNVSTKIRFKKNTCVKADTFNMKYRRVVTYNWYYDKAKKETTTKTDKTDWTLTSNEEVPVSYAPGWAKALNADQYAIVEWQAFTRGIAGRSCDEFNNKTGDWDYKEKLLTTRRYVYAWPAKPTIDKEKVNWDKTRQMLSIPIKTNHKANRNPVDKVTLQYNNSTQITKAAELGEVNWSNVDNMEDNGNCSGFQAPTQDIAPAVGNRLWIRVKAEHGSYTRYSDPMRVDALYIAEPTAADDKCEILSSSYTHADGKGVTLNIGVLQGDGNTGTEVSWSTYSGAWWSNEEPSTLKVERPLETNKDTGTKAQWPKMHIVHLRGLEEGQLYYVRARRYRESDNGTTYSPYSKASFTPSSQPAAVWLTLPEAISYGDDLPVTWAYDSSAEQKHYAVYDPAKPKQLWAYGTDANGYVIVPWEDVKSKSSYAEEESVYDTTLAATDIQDNEGNSIYTEAITSQGATVTLRVKMDTGGLSQVSDASTTAITRQPAAALEVVQDGDFFKRLGSGVIGMVSQGGTVKVNTTAKKALVNLTLITEGSIRAYPDGFREVMMDGDVVWSDVYTDETSTEESTDEIWLVEADSQERITELIGGNIASITCRLPEDLDLLDGMNYTLLATVTDLETGLSSEPASCPFQVEWAHKAVLPVVVTVPSQEDMTVTIGVFKPEGGRDDDVVDIYRATPDGYYLIAAGISWGSLVLDRYAPYSNDWGDGLFYRVSTRTTDGDEIWVDDGDYQLYGYSLRFDWGEGETLELPYNLSIADTWDKGFEARKHMDGTYGGYFDGSVMRTATLSTDMIKVSTDQDKRRVRDLANHTGPVFVRTPMGNAYSANVVPNNMTYEFNNPIVKVSFNVTEFKLVDEFKVLSDDIVSTGYSTLEEYLASLQ